MNFIMFGAMDVTKPYELQGLGPWMSPNPMNLQGLDDFRARGRAAQTNVTPIQLVYGSAGSTAGILATSFSDVSPTFASLRASLPTGLTLQGLSYNVPDVSSHFLFFICGGPRFRALVVVSGPQGTPVEGVWDPR